MDRFAYDCFTSHDLVHSQRHRGVASEAALYVGCVTFVLRNQSAGAFGSWLKEDGCSCTVDKSPISEIVPNPTFRIEHFWDKHGTRWRIGAATLRRTRSGTALTHAACFDQGFLSVYQSRIRGRVAKAEPSYFVLHRALQSNSKKQHDQTRLLGSRRFP
mmetsp:Transcript_7642/g.21256  ORF Transcript_7642/g.21256 Transcript_7642/m.21256 type:complete len:159 (-) Transcript_7642:1171-1647(-)